jgi:hypothetical protein
MDADGEQEGTTSIKLLDCDLEFEAASQSHDFITVKPEPIDEDYVIEEEANTVSNQ